MPAKGAAASGRKRVRRPAQAAAQAQRTPDAGPQRYRADTYHEIESGGGVLRVEVGDIVVTTEKGVEVMPPARFREAYPDLTDG